MSYGGAAAAIAAEKARLRAEEEEEKLTTYNADDMDKWEFKIVRSPFGAFRSAEKIKQVCEEEAKAGWEMLEKFDNNRIRFKRRIEKRSADSYLTTDPYRTNVSSSSSLMGVIIVGILFLLFGVAALLFFINGGYIAVTDPLPLIIAIGLILLIVTLIINKKKS